MKNDRLEKIKFNMFKGRFLESDMWWLINKLEDYNEQLERLSIKCKARRKNP